MIGEHAAVRAEHAFLEQRRVEKIRIAHPSETRLRCVLTKSLSSYSLPDLAHAREARRQRACVRGKLFFRRRIVERAVDPHGAKQWITRVLLESLGGLRTAVAPVIDVAKPAVVGPC